MGDVFRKELLCKFYEYKNELANNLYSYRCRYRTHCKIIIKINKENISKFHINYFDIRQSYHGTIMCITANIKIDTFDGNHFEIKSTGTIIGLVNFLSQNCNKIPNYSCHTDSEAMEKYLNLIQKK